MLTPQQLADAPNNMVRLYQQLEDDIIADIAEKIAAQDYFTAASDWQVQKLVVMNNSYKDILKKLSAATGKTQAEIRRLMEEAASESLKYDDAIYNAAGVNLATLNQSAALLNTLNAGIKKTEGVFVNLCKTTAIQTSRQLVRELDAAYMKVSSGAFSPDAAIDSACRSLAKDGMTAFYYESGRRISLEAAVRLNIRTGVAQTCAKIQEQRLQEAGCELVQTTAHLGARPSHVPWQGKVFMMNGRSEKYGNLEEETGYGTVTGLCGANCRHNFFPFYEGISVNQYTQESLDELAAKKVRYNGEDIGVYEATQKQRALERKVREAKRYKEAAKAAGISTAKADANLRRATDELSNFTAQTGLKRQYGREKIFPLVYKQAAFTSKGNGTEIMTYGKLKMNSTTAKNITAKYTKRPSAFNGNIIMNNTINGAGSDGSLYVLPENSLCMMIHEHFHFRSISKEPALFDSHNTMEEAVVQYLTKNVCVENGIKYTSSEYEEMVEALEKMRPQTKFDKDIDFAKHLYELPVDQRLNWIKMNINGFEKEKGEFETEWNVWLLNKSTNI